MSSLFLLFLWEVGLKNQIYFRLGSLGVSSVCVRNDTRVGVVVVESTCTHTKSLVALTVSPCWQCTQAPCAFVSSSTRPSHTRRHTPVAHSKSRPYSFQRNVNYIKLVYLSTSLYQSQLLHSLHEESLNTTRSEHVMHVTSYSS